MMPNWTESQRKAIETQNRSLLVSAGAGSGKTTVLTERILRRLIAGGDVSRLLVVTFTKAAASDMKEKLYAALSRAIAENPTDRHLRGQLYRLSGARICTIHSFCYELIRRHFAVLGLSPKVRVADAAECAILSKRCVSETLEHFYQTGGEDFFALLGNFDSEKSDEPFVKLLLSCYDRIRAYPDYLGFLDEVADKLRCERENAARDGIFATEAGRLVCKESVRVLGRMLDKARALLEFVSATADSERQIAPVEGLLEQLGALSEAPERGYTALRDALGAFAPPRLYTLKMDPDQAELLKAGKTEIVDAVRKLQKDYFALPEDEAAADFAKTADIFAPLIAVLRDYDARFSAAKHERKVVDFSDLEHLTVRLLTERHEEGYVRTPLCRKLQSEFDELCIDEYQDVNRLQDLIFASVARNDNRFMVGDVKQSIYRFRNAEPEIFESYRNDYDGGNTGETVFLRENFRCNRCITEFVNAVLTPVYTKENTGSDYASEALIFAKPGPDVRLPVQAALCVLGEDGKQSDGVAAEAAYVASEIRRLVAEERLQNGERIRYSDIAILFRTVRGFSEPYENALERCGIPVRTERADAFMTRPEIELALALLKAVDNPADDIAVAAAMRSPIYRFTADELFRIARFADAGCFYDKVRGYASVWRNRTRVRGAVYRRKALPSPPLFRAAPAFFSVLGRNVSLPLAEKCLAFTRELAGLRAQARGMTSHAFLWLLYSRTGLPAIAAADEDGEKKAANLRTLYSFAEAFESSSYKGLSAFLDHFADIYDSYSAGPDASFSPSGEDCVRLMSVHKSKGLEFPVCFVVGLGKAINVSDTRDRFMIDPSFGVAFKLREGDGVRTRDTLLRRAAAVAERQKLLCEELRALYVALTRGRERLYVTATVGYDALETDVDFADTRAAVDWLVPVLRKPVPSMFNCRILDSGYTGRTAPSPQPVAAADVALQQAALAAVGYVYPHARACGVAAKMSVSELRRGLLEDDEYTHTVRRSDFSRRPAFLGGQEVRPAERGTANHVFMQFASFDRVERDGVRAEILRLLADRMLTPEQAGMIESAALEIFFASPLYTRMRASPALYREKRFTVSEDAVRLTGESGDRVLIQGVVDCFFENESGGFTVVDYKTDAVPATADGERKLIKRHALQLRYYCRAVASMTGRPVTEALLWSFALGKALPVAVE